MEWGQQIRVTSGDGNGCRGVVALMGVLDSDSDSGKCSWIWYGIVDDLVMRGSQGLMRSCFHCSIYTNNSMFPNDLSCFREHHRSITP